MMQYLNAFKDEGDDAKEHKDRSYILRGSGECVVESLFSLNFANHNSPWLLSFTILKKKKKTHCSRSKIIVISIFYFILQLFQFIYTFSILFLIDIKF